MAVAQTAERISKQAGNGATTGFSGSWKIYVATDLKVYKINAAGVYSALLTNAVDYTVAFDSDAETWTVTYTVAPVSGGYAVIIGSAMSETQASSFPREGVTPASTIKNALDKLTVLLHQLRDKVERVPIQPETPVNPNNQITIDTPVTRRALVYEISGSDIEIVPSAYDPDTLQTAAAASATAAASSATSAASSATAAAASATAAAASATLAATLSLAYASGTRAARPAAPATNYLYEATDEDQLYIWTTISARWRLIG